MTRSELLQAAHDWESELAKRHLARNNFTDYNRYVCIDGEEPQQHHIKICEATEKVVTETNQRIMLFMPPGSAKSTYATVRLPSYYLSKTKRKGVICSSYGDNLAASFGRKVRNLVLSPEHQDLFGTKLAQDSKAKGEWETQDGGFYYSCGVGGAVTGRRADLAVIDDPIKSRADADSETVRNKTWEWYMSDLRTRLKPDASLIIIQTRWHEDDLSGRILPDNWNGESGEILSKQGETWNVICMSAEAGENDPLGRKLGEWLWLEWFTREWWEKTKASQSARNWSSLYQQQPSADDGNIFKREWFSNRYSKTPSELNYYMSGDYAVTDSDGADYTFMGVWGVDSSDVIYLIDWWFGKSEIDTYVEHWIRLVKEYKPFWHRAEMGVIRRALEPTLKRVMKREKAYTVLNWTPTTGDKVAKSRGFQALTSNSEVRLPVDLKDGEIILDQLVKFPTGKNDDAVDMCSEFAYGIAETWQAKDKTPPPPKKDKTQFLAGLELTPIKKKSSW